MAEFLTASQRLVFAMLLCVASALCSFSQGGGLPQNVPPNFHEDHLFAAQTRPQLVGLSQPCARRFPAADEVLKALLRRVPAQPESLHWEVRAAAGAGNVFSLPDGLIVVDEQLAESLGTNRGFWAATLAHEVAHVLRRDWARRYLFEQTLGRSGSSQFVLGESGGADSWVDPSALRSQAAAFLQGMEMDADSEGAMLMARAGFHPAFMLALYQWLQGQPHQIAPELLESSHPAWRERNERLRTILNASGAEFDRHWPDQGASPGGNAPVLVYAGRSFARAVGREEVEIRIPLRCDNLYGSLDVVLQLSTDELRTRPPIHQYTGCTSNPTWVTFTVPREHPKHKDHSALVSVLDNSGVLLARWWAPGTD